jgi:hypothetical protein
MMINAAKVYPHNTPVNKEAYYYRMIFERLFPQVTNWLSLAMTFQIAFVFAFAFSHLCW